MGRNIFFDSEEDFVSFLKKQNYATDSWQRILAHERAHFDRALQLGYSPQYAVQLTGEIPCFPVFPICYYIKFIDKQPCPEDLIAICLAPEEPSESDINLVESLRNAFRTR